jgi:hypothetical protein
MTPQGGSYWRVLILYDLLDDVQRDMLKSVYQALGVPMERMSVIPHSEKEGTKHPYVCPECSNHTYSNNMITRIHVQ